MVETRVGDSHIKQLVTSFVSGRGYDYAITSMVWAALLYLLFRTGADPDLWGHVRFGQDLWQSGRLILTDPYSYVTAGQPWINHEWLSEVLFYLSYAVGGDVGLIALRVSMLLVVA